MKEYGLLESAAVKVQTLKTAIEVSLLCYFSMQSLTSAFVFRSPLACFSASTRECIVAVPVNCTADALAPTGSSRRSGRRETEETACPEAAPRSLRREATCSPRCRDVCCDITKSQLERLLCCLRSATRLLLSLLLLLVRSSRHVCSTF